MEACRFRAPVRHRLHFLQCLSIMFTFGELHNCNVAGICNDNCIICNCSGCQALAEAIQSVTEMNQDLAVEKIEIETATDLEVNGPK